MAGQTRVRATGKINGGGALAVLLVYLVFGLVALAVDRRALLVSALGYVLYALGSLFGILLERLRAASDGLVQLAASNRRQHRRFYNAIGEAAEAERVSLEERNARWIGQLETLFQDGPCLVAVGAVHLVGGDGLLAALRRDGYTVEALPW